MPGYDVAVVGAGPAGSAAARAAAARGLRVLLVERRAEIGRPVQCAEYVPQLILREASLPAACVAQRIARLRTYLPDGESCLMAAPGLILERALFDKHLAIEATRAGADILLRTTAIARTARGLAVRKGGHEREIEATVIIGADGPASTVGRWIGQRHGELIAAAQYAWAAEGTAPETEVYFAPEYVGGYAWLFPKGATVNVGVGLVGSARDAARALEGFVERLQAAGRLRPARAVAYTAGRIPAGGLLRGGQGNILLAGDAGGAVHPLTGAGILFALISGRLAGEAAAEAVQAGDLERLAAYEQRRDEAMGAVIARGLASRRRLWAAGTSDPGALSRLVRQNWIAFAGYGHDTVRRNDGD